VAALAEVNQRKGLLLKDAGDTPQQLVELMQLSAVAGTLALGTLDPLAAAREFSDLEAGLVKLKDAKAVQLLKGEVDRVWVPYLPRPLTVKEALALAVLLDRQTNPVNYSQHLATLAASEAFRGTAYLGGVNALQFFASAAPPTAGDFGGWWRVSEEFARLFDSGLAPQPSRLPPETAKENAADRTLDLRRRRLAGLTVGVRVPLPAVAKKDAQWVTPEEALALYFGQTDSVSARYAAAYPAWVARRAVAPRRSGLGLSAPFLATENEKILEEIGRVRRAHAFPHASAAGPGDQYPAENDAGVAAVLRGDFTKAEEHFIAASQSDLGPGLLPRRMALGGRLTRADPRVVVAGRHRSGIAVTGSPDRRVELPPGSSAESGVPALPPRAVRRRPHGHVQGPRGGAARRGRAPPRPGVSAAQPDRLLRA